MSNLSVSDIRKIRNKYDKIYANMTHEEVSRDITRRAAEGHRIIEEIRRQKAAANRPPTPPAP